MRVCFVLPKIPVAPNGKLVGGATNCAVGLASSLREYGVDLDIIAPISEAAKAALAFHPILPLLKEVKSVDGSMWFRGGIALFNLRKDISRHHLERPYDVIHIHSGTYIYGIAAASPAIQGVIKVHSIYCPIVTEDQMFIEQMGRRMLAGWTTQNTDCIVGVTRNVCNSIRKTRIPESKLSFLPMAVDTKEFSGPSEEEQTGLFQQGKDHVRLLFVGNASVEKGLDVLMDALGLLKKKGVDFQLVAALENQSRLREFESRREMIGHKVKELGLGKYINITGVIKKVDTLLKEAEIVVLPFQNVKKLKRVSDYPMVLLEGMACGKCVVATPLKGISEIVRDGVNGILSETFTSQSLSEALLRGITNRDMRLSAGIAARDTIEQKFSTRIVASQLLVLYRRLLSVLGK